MVLLRIAIIVIKCQDQNNLGRKGLSSSYTLTSPFTNNGSQDKNIEEAGTEAEAMGDCFLQVCSSWIASSHRLQDPYSRGVSTHNGLSIDIF